jgi:hypothetical protein
MFTCDFRCWHFQSSAANAAMSAVEVEADEDRVLRNFRD